MILDCVTTIGESHMSRTYRRKNAHEEFEYTYELEVIFDRGGSFLRYDRFLEGVELKESLARYHSDDPAMAWAIDAIIRRSINRSLRSKNKQILRCAVRDCNDEPMFIPPTKDLQYNYW